MRTDPQPPQGTRVPAAQSRARRPRSGLRPEAGVAPRSEGVPPWDGAKRRSSKQWTIRRKSASLRVCILAALLISLVGCSDKTEEPVPNTEPAASAKVYQWKIITTWPKFLPGAGMSAENLAERLRVMSDGRLDIRVYGAGELVGAFEVFDAVSAGTAEMGHGAAYYWRGKIPAAPLFSAIPFGMTAQEMNAWLRYGGGLELWRELYAPFNLVPFPAGNTGVQMAGWFNEEINALEDLAGLKMRIPGLGGEVLERSGGVPVTIPGGEVFTALQTGVIDATEWVGPYNDLALGLYSAGRYYYYPGWHEPGTVLELIVNREAFEALPADLQAMVATTAQAINDDTLADYTARSVAALETLEREHGVLLRSLPAEVIDQLREASLQVVAEVAGEDELSQRIYESYTGFLDGVRRYTGLTEKAYLETR